DADLPLQTRFEQFTDHCVLTAGSAALQSILEQFQTPQIHPPFTWPLRHVGKLCRQLLQSLFHFVGLCPVKLIGAEKAVDPVGFEDAIDRGRPGCESAWDMFGW